MSFEKSFAKEAWRRKRSHDIFQVVQYNWIIVPTLWYFLYCVGYYFLDKRNGGIFETGDTSTWSWTHRVFLLMSAPCKPLSVMCLLSFCFPIRPFRLSKQPIKRQFRKLIICLVTRGDQVEVVKRSVSAAQDIYRKVDDRISFYVLTEEKNAHSFRGIFKDHISILGVPESYRAKKAQYKARSLEWFRIKMQLHNDDWVLHIDEETIVDEFALKTCVDFITRQDYAEMGQGIIHFNCHNYWENLITTVGDIGRIKGDWGFFQWRANWLHQAAVGVRGSFLILSGAVENAVTWEGESLTEDYSFCLEAIRQGFQIGWLPAIAREISPASVYDYIRQRRRWYTGIRGLGDPCGQYVLFGVVMSGAQSLYLAFMILTRQWSISIPSWIYSWSVFETIADQGITILLVFMQDWDGDVPWYYMIRNQILVLLIQPFIIVLDAYAVLTSLWNPDKWFYIIEKK